MKAGYAPWMSHQLTAGPCVSIWGFSLLKNTFFVWENIRMHCVGIDSCNKDNLRAGEPPHGNCVLLLQSLLCLSILQICSS